MDREHFTNHVQRCQRDVRRFLTALCCGDTDLADDLAQDTFVKAYLSCDDFREEAKFSTWIYRIAYNTFAGYRRRPPTLTSIEEAAYFHGSEKTDCSFEYQTLYLALSRLSDKERSSILLFYMQGYSIKEIAAINDSTTDAVKQHLSRGRKHLRSLLKDSHGQQT